MEHIIGGYYLVEGVNPAPWSHLSRLPAMFWSISDCIATLHPPTQLLSWATETAEQAHILKQELQLSDEKFAAATSYVDACFDGEALGWPSVWFSVERVRFYAASYLSHRRNIRLLGIALPDEYYHQAIADFKPHSERHGETGIFKTLTKHLVVHDAVRVLGYEILGNKASRGLHSFVCNGLEQEYIERLGITLNANGLISAYWDAKKATHYTNLETMGAEPVLWLPWRVFELPL